SAPVLTPLSSAASGRRTHRTISAPLSVAAAVLPMVAPASANCASSMRDRVPAPFSTTTSAPRPMSLATVSGVAATRLSPTNRSRSTAIFIGILLPACPGQAWFLGLLVRSRSGIDEEIQDDHRHHGGVDHPFHAGDEAIVGFFVFGVVHGGFQYRLGMMFRAGLGHNVLEKYSRL